MNPTRSAAGTALAADGHLAQPGRAEGTWAWLTAVSALVLMVNVMFSRYLWGDTYFDLYAGRYIAAHGLPHTNVFTAASQAAPWTDQQWLAHLLYYGAWSAGGYAAVGVLSAALITSGYTILAAVMLRQGVAPTRAFAWVLAAFATAVGSNWITAQSFAYPCLALTVWLILDDRRSPRLRARTWLVVPVLVLWANTHGSVLLGAGLVVLYAACRATASLSRHDAQSALPYLLFAVLAAACVVCTPYGISEWRYYASLIGNTALTHSAAQWMAPTLGNPLSWAFFALVAAVAVAVAVAWRRGVRPDPVLAGIALATLALALTAARNAAWFGFGGSLLAAGTLARSREGHTPAVGKVLGRLTAGALAAIALLGLAGLATTPQGQFESLIPRHAIDAAASAQAQDPALLVLGDDWSGTAMLWLHPALRGRVGFDARFEQYSTGQLSAFFDFLAVHGPRWPRASTGYAIIVVSRRAHAQLATALTTLPGWRVLYRDREGIALERQAPA